MVISISIHSISNVLKTIFSTREIFHIEIYHSINKEYIIKQYINNKYKTRIYKLYIVSMFICYVSVDRIYYINLTGDIVPYVSILNVSSWLYFTILSTVFLAIRCNV